MAGEIDQLVQFSLLHFLFCISLRFYVFCLLVVLVERTTALPPSTMQNSHGRITPTNSLRFNGLFPGELGLAIVY